jgi:predicted nucleic acid-binding Zn ribbon protein
MAESRKTRRLTSAPTGPTVLKDALDKYLKSAGLSRRVQQASVLDDWARLVVTEPDSVTADGVLRVRVASAPWASELGLMTPTILARINTGRTGRIKSIRWMPGGFRRRDGVTP